MKQERIGADAPDADPGVRLAREQGSHSRKPVGTPVPKQRRPLPPLPNPESGISVKEWADGLVRLGLFDAVQVVSGDLGPIGLIGNPRVVVAELRGCFFVFLERRPWGQQWVNANKEFYRLGAAVSYARKLAASIRKVALAEQERQERRQDAYLREKFGDGR